MKKYLFILLMLPLISYSQIEFCEHLSNENFPALKENINSIFVEYNLDPLGQSNLGTKFVEIDSVMKLLNRKECIDTVYYKGSRGIIMESIPQQTDIILVNKLDGFENKYIVRLIFRNYTQVVFFREWKYE